MINVAPMLFLVLGVLDCGIFFVLLLDQRTLYISDELKCTNSLILDLL